MVLLTTGCGERASVQELTGTYEKKLETGREHIELHSDMTFLEVFVTPEKKFTAQGKWTLANIFLGPTKVTLMGDYATDELPPGLPHVSGQRILIVHKERGRLRLAFNEAADWFYDRI